MIKKLNNKGMTTVEILVSFVLVVIISVSLYSVVSTYINKQHVESYKDKITTYKNLLTKEIQDDLIKKGLIAASVKKSNNDKNTELTMTFKDGSSKVLLVYQQLSKGYDGTGEKVQDDEFSIAYGEKKSGEVDFTSYTLPDLGSNENEAGEKVYDLRIHKVDINTDNNILTIKIDFYHPDFSNRYGIDIVCPINF